MSAEPRSHEPHGGSEAWSGLVARSAPIGLFVATIEFEGVYVNPAWSELTGLSSEEALGAGLRRPLHPDDAPSVERQWRRLVRAWSGGSIEHRLLTAAGGIHFVRTTFDVVQASDGSPRCVGAVIDLTARHRLEQRLSHAANHDDLTGLPNRAALFERTELALAAMRAGSPGPALLFIDLDGFKEVNDTHGHALGDDVLRLVASRLSSCVRATDTVARLGGDEFVVLAVAASGEDTQEIAQRIVERISEPIEPAPGRVVHIGASVGIAPAWPGITAGNLLRAADLAVYQAKLAGGATVRTFRAAPPSTRG